MHGRLGHLGPLHDSIGLAVAVRWPPSQARGLPSMAIFIVMAAFDAEPKNKVGHLAAWTL